MDIATSDSDLNARQVSLMIHAPPGTYQSQSQNESIRNSAAADSGAHVESSTATATTNALPREPEWLLQMQQDTERSIAYMSRLIGDRT